MRRSLTTDADGSIVGDIDYRAGLVKVGVAKLIGSGVTGRAVGLLSRNKVRNHGLTFDLADPVVSPQVKAMLAFRMYESSEIRMIRTHLAGARQVVELGASLGITGSHAMAVMAPEGHLVAVEANPDLMPCLEGNLRAHRRTASVQTLNAAIAHNNTSVFFGIGEQSTDSRVAKEGLRVRATTLSEVIEHLPGGEEYHLVSDIEGAEIDLLLREPESLAGCIGGVIELHPSPEHSLERLVSLLRQTGLEIAEARGPVVAITRA